MSLTLKTTERNMNKVRKFYKHFIESEFENDAERFEITKRNNFVDILDNNKGENYTFNFPTAFSDKYIKSISLVDDKVHKLVDMNFVYKLISKYADINALVSLENIVFIYDESEDYFSKTRDTLFSMYGDEYSLCLCDEQLGLTWIERQTVVVNVSNILHSTINTADFEFELISTIFHELRHLVYETNPFIKGYENIYPTNGGDESEVEYYGWKSASSIKKIFKGHFVR